MMMEFCPEVAVLQSAFQLVQSKAGNQLKTVSKTDCTDYVAILRTSLEEICQGLESDLTPREQLLWQQDMHTLVLYALVRSRYREKEEKEGMPVCSSLDMLVAVLPEFSCHLYFQLVKACSWEQQLINCLSYLDPSVSVSLLQDLIQHCMQEPVSAGDCEMVNYVRETLLTKVISVPFEVDLSLEKQLMPLSKPDRYIPLTKENMEDVESTHYSKTEQPEMFKSTATINRHSVLTEEEKKEMLKDAEIIDYKPTETDGSETNTTYVSVQLSAEGPIGNLQGLKETKKSEELNLNDDKLLWSQFLSENPSCLVDLLTFTESHLNKDNSDFDYMKYLAQLALIGFIKIVKTPTDSCYKWFLFNIYRCHSGPGLDLMSDSLLEIGPVYVLNIPLADQINNQIDTEQWLTSIYKLLEHIQHNDSTGRSVSDAGNQTDSTVVKEISEGDDTVQIVASICVKKVVLNRMIQGCLTELEKDVKQDKRSNLEECREMIETISITDSETNIRKQIETERGMKTSEMDEESCIKEDTCLEVVIVTEGDNYESSCKIKGVKYGDSCWSDVTLEALCWRIQQRLPYCQDCVEMLLESHCRDFWFTERVYDSFNDNCQIVMVKDRVKKLLNILPDLVSASREVILKAQRLSLTAFTGLSCLDQDLVAMEMYVKGTSMKDYLGLDDLQAMTVFNRITALRDDQILSELFVLCLCDPQDVISTAVKMSVRNKEQATNFAQVLQFFPTTCHVSHPTHHPDTTLLGHVIREFLLATRLTDKEQKTFLVFLSSLMKINPHVKKLPVLSPLELMHLVIVPYVNVHNLNSSEPISCKFALNILKTVLEGDCVKDCDWTEYEPMALLVCLTELLQECVIFCDDNDDISGVVKMTVKGLVKDCLKQMTKMFQDGTMVATEKAVNWFKHCLIDMDLPVVLQLAEIMRALSLEEFVHGYEEEVKKLLGDFNSNLTLILMIASLDSGDVQFLLSEHQPTGSISYDEVIVALIQVLPNFLNSEFENVIHYVMSLIQTDVLPIPYRLENTVHIPLIGMKDFQTVLGISQLLRDVIIALGLLSDRINLLHQTPQCYTAFVKTLISVADSSSVEMNLFIQSQLFYHVCDVVHYLPHGTGEPVLVLLLHLLTVYTDTLKSRDKVGRTQKWKKSISDNITHNIYLSVESLPEETVEKDMLRKKITDMHIGLDKHTF